jgi:hypothetical protein
MNSSAWGPGAWVFLFHIAMGYDFNETPKKEKDVYYKNFFKSIGNVLCCKYCRESYPKFYDKLNIDRYLELPSCGLVRFVYDIKELVNDKLRKQEKEAIKEEYNKLKQMNLSEDEIWTQMRAICHKKCYTKPTPPFEEVVENLLKNRAGCSANMKTCREPILNSLYPQKLPEQIDIENKKDIDLYFGGIKKNNNNKKKSYPKKSKRRSIRRKSTKRK